MNASGFKSSRLFTVWFRTLAVSACALVACCWVSTLFRASLPWHPNTAFQVMRDWSSVAVLALFGTACLGWRSHRILAATSLALCLAWLIWVELPRL
jgi:hypothetical protein